MSWNSNRLGYVRKRILDRPSLSEFDILQTFGMIGFGKESRVLDLFFLNAMVVQRAFRCAEVAFSDTVSTWVGN
jgi:hypothetical protein